MPRLGFTKRRDDGSVDFVSPIPCPFNYGSVPGTRSGDGDRVDAVVLGRRLSRGARVTLPVVACATFTDAGADDPKWICSALPITIGQRVLVAGFFRLYARTKRVLNALRHKRGHTGYGGITLRAGGPR